MDIAPEALDAPQPGRHVSFVLRCWMGERNQVRARLISAHSGVGHTVTELSELPQLVAQLVREELAPQEEDVPDSGAE